MEAGSSVSMRVITVITRRTQPCEALFFTRARKLHTNCRRTDFWRGMVRFAKASARQSSFDHCEASEGWRRGELNPCLRRNPRKREFQAVMDFEYVAGHNQSLQVSLT